MMPPGRPRRIERPEEYEAEDVPRPQGPSSIAKAEVDDLLTSLSAGATCKIYRIPANGEPEVLDNVDVGVLKTESSPELYVGKRYGPGYYLLRFRVPKPDGRGTEMGGERRIRVAEDMEGVKQPEKQEEPGSVVDKALSAGVLSLVKANVDMVESLGRGRDGSGNEVLLALMTAQQRSAEMMMQAMQHNSTQIAQMMQAMASQQSAVLTAIIPLMGKGGSDVGAAMKLAELFAQKSSGQNADDILGTFEKLLAVRERLVGDGDGGGESLTAVAVRSLLPLIAGALKPGESPVADASPPSAGPVQQLPEQTPQRIEEVAMWGIEQLRPFITEWARLAARRRDPVAYATMIADQLEEQPMLGGYVRRMLAERNESGAFVLDGQLGQRFPEVLMYSEWFAELIRELRILLEIIPDEEEPAESSTPVVRPKGEGRKAGA
jgi:hypothetical protein